MYPDAAEGIKYQKQQDSIAMKICTSLEDILIALNGIPDSWVV